MLKVCESLSLICVNSSCYFVNVVFFLINWSLNCYTFSNLFEISSFILSMLFFKSSTSSDVLTSAFYKALKLLSLISYSALVWAAVFWLLSFLAIEVFSLVGSWFDIYKTLAVCSRISLIFFSILSSSSSSLN